MADHPKGPLQGQRTTVELPRLSEDEPAAQRSGAVSPADQGRLSGVFLCYRREDTRHVAGRLGDRLSARFGRVFMDIDTIEPGVDFTEVIRQAVGECDVLLALIGDQWVSAVDERGRRRLDDPNDWIVEEIKVALRRGIRVIPVLVDGARMPSRDQLPEVLAPLARRQALTVRHESFSSDAARLIAAIERRDVAITEGNAIVGPVMLIVRALAAGEVRGLDEASATTIKDAHTTLKSAVAAKFAGKQAAQRVLAEHAKDPATYDRALAEQIRATGVDQDPRIVELAQALMALMDEEAAWAGKYRVDLRGAQGVQVGGGNTQTNTFNR